ncbi:hypothetical protein ACS0TY_033283 [Phlomoides rotata]
MGELPPYVYKHSKSARRNFWKGWHMDDEQDLIDCVERLLLVREIGIWKDWNKLLRDVKIELDGKMYHDYDLNGYAMKMESLVNFYVRFKLFVFKTPGVQFNFMTNQAIVDDTYWNYIRVRRQGIVNVNAVTNTKWLIHGNHSDCLDNLRVDHNAFGRLCIILRNRGGKHISVEEEEKVLINALKDLVNKGWKSDNGFRAGYLTKCEDALKEDFAKTDLQATPHITSKMTAWKKSYSSLVTAHTTTGVGFNTTTSQLECTDDEWDSVVKKSSNERHVIQIMTWIDIFGLDRATGSIADDMVEMAKCLKNLYGQSPPVVIQQEHDGANYKSGGSQ